MRKYIWGRFNISIIPKLHPTTLLLPKPFLSPPQQPGLCVIVLDLVIEEYLVILWNILLGVQFH